MTSGALVPIANHLWQSTLFAAAVWLGTLLLRSNAASLRHRLWLAASVKFLVPFSLLVGLGAQFPLRTARVAAPRQISVVVNPIGTPLRMMNGAVETPLQPLSSRLPAALAVLWFFGFAGCVGSWSVRWKQLHRILRRGIPLDLDIPVRTVSSSERIEPGVFGVFRPVLLLPQGIAQRLTPDQLRAMIAHEMSHVRRRDNVTSAIHMLVEALFWFHPLVWWIERRLIEEQERACDEEVLRQGGDPQVYAESILRICELYLTSPIICVPGISGSDLNMRIREIMRNGVVRPLSPAGRVLLSAAALLVLVGPVVVGLAVRAQTPAQSAPFAGTGERRQSFEVASIKPDKTGCENIPRRGSLSPSPGRLEMPCVNLWNLIQAAYGTFGDGVSINTQTLHMEGGLSWMQSEYYTVSGKATGPERVETLAGPMLQTLLEDRFRLQVHRETREMPVYVLTVERRGLKLKPLAEDACIAIDLAHPPPPPKAGEGPPNVCGLMMIRPMTKGNMIIDVRGSTMTQFAQRLSNFLDRTVVDNTETSGRFNFNLEFMPDPRMPGQAFPPARGGDPADPGTLPNQSQDANSGPNLFTAVQEQLGLKIESAKGPVSVLRIDHVERASEN